MSRSPETRPASLADKILANVESGELQLPPLPDLLLRLRRVLEGKHADAAAAAHLIRNEPALVTSLLRAANSAFYSGLAPVKSLKQAIARLGLQQVVALVTAFVHKDSFKSDDRSTAKVLQVLWDHAVVTALAARRLALRDGADGEEAFLAGLLHDTGRLVVLRGVEMLQENGEEPLTEVVVAEAMDALHTDLGFRTLTQWNLPETICRACHQHHDNLVDSEDTLLLRVQLADRIARKLGAHLYPDPRLNLLNEVATERLNLGDVELATLMVDLEDELEKVHDLFR